MKRFLTALSTAFLLAVGLAVAPPATAAEVREIYVAPDGDDDAAGSIDAPLRTLEAARDLLRTERDSGDSTEGATVYLREGSYPRSSSFELSAEDSGTAEAPIVYRSYPGETARLTGGLELDKADFVPIADASVRARIIDESARDKVLQIDLAALGIDDYGR